MPTLATVDGTGLDSGKKCPECDAQLPDNIGLELCTQCGHSLKTSKWQVISLGEMQQPSGVGAAQPQADSRPAPALDQPGHDSEFADAGGNSFEQNVALETWVNYAVDMLNRGREESDVMAQLAHDGCPEPQTVVKRALEQPEEAPLGNEGAEDPFEVPYQDGQSQNNMESVSQQPPVMPTTAAAKTAEDNTQNVEKPKKGDQSIFEVEQPPKTKGELFDVDEPEGSDNHTDPITWKDKVPVQDTKDVHKGSRVRVVGTRFAGVVAEEWSDTWGQQLIRVALDEGGSMNVAPNQIEPDVGGKLDSPVSEIQAFIDAIPEVEPSRPSIMAGVANFEQVRRAVRSNISKCSFTDQVVLEGIDIHARAAISNLTEALRSYSSPEDQAYTSSLPKYHVHALEVSGVERQVVTNHRFNSRIRENAAIWLSEQDPVMLADRGQTIYAAARHAEQHNGNIQGFVAAVQLATDLIGPDESQSEIMTPPRQCPDCGQVKRATEPCPGCGSSHPGVSDHLQPGNPEY